MMAEITGVNRHLGCAFIDHEIYVWVTEWLNEDGEECAEPYAVSCVAGDEENGWFAVDLTKFSRTNVN